MLGRGHAGLAHRELAGGDEHHVHGHVVGHDREEAEHGRLMVPAPARRQGQQTARGRRRRQQRIAAGQGRAAEHAVVDRIRDRRPAQLHAGAVAVAGGRDRDLRGVEGQGGAGDQQRNDRDERDAGHGDLQLSAWIQLCGAAMVAPAGGMGWTREREIALRRGLSKP